MEALTKITYCHSPVSPSLRRPRPSISTLFSFKPPPSSSPFKIKSSPIKALSASSSSLSKFLLPNPKILKSQPSETLIPPPNPILRTAFVAAVTAAAIFFSRFNLRPLLAAPSVAPPPNVESAGEEKRNLEEQLNSNSNEIESLRNLMESKIKDGKIPEAIVILEKLIQIQPEEIEWRLLKSHMHLYSDDVQSATLGFNEIIKRDPLRVEAYHGLLMVVSKTESDAELEELNNRIEDAMELAKDENLRDFKLLYAQIQVIAGDYKESLKIYDELVNENPKDFRPHLCKGIICTLLKEKDEAEKSFQKYRDLVPKGHPYAKHFDEHMLATKLFLQNVENEMKR